jgi:hypothetical protein
MFLQNEIVSFVFFQLRILFKFGILASNDPSDESPRKIEVIHNPNQTVKPIKQDPVEPRRIPKQPIPDPGK